LAPPPPTPPSPPPPPFLAIGAQHGDWEPDTHPGMETIFIPTSFDLEYVTRD
jgi:hypothetical protein